VGRDAGAQRVVDRGQVALDGRGFGSRSLMTCLSQLGDGSVQSRPDRGLGHAEDAADLGVGKFARELERDQVALTAITRPPRT
jgi:hypothetical protein